jgi:hypothetical protein
MQNFLYALIQIAHNFGAVSIVGLGAYGLFFADGQPKRHVAILQACAWAVQGTSGALFGIVTYLYYQHLPDIQGVAIIALIIKIGCVMLGFCLATTYAWFDTQWPASTRRLVWTMSFILGLVALSSAAFLRWFS